MGPISNLRRTASSGLPVCSHRWSKIRRRRRRRSYQGDESLTRSAIGDVRHHHHQLPGQQATHQIDKSLTRSAMETFIIIIISYQGNKPLTRSTSHSTGPPWRRSSSSSSSSLSVTQGNKPLNSRPWRQFIIIIIISYQGNKPLTRSTSHSTGRPWRQVIIVISCHGKEPLTRSAMETSYHRYQLPW